MTVAWVLRLPALACTLLCEVGATPAMRGLPSAAIASASLRVMVCRGPPRTSEPPPKLPRALPTVSKLVPSASRFLVTPAVLPDPIAVSAITAATPMMTPSAVSILRSGVPIMARQAIVAAPIRPMPPPERAGCGNGGETSVSRGRTVMEPPQPAGAAGSRAAGGGGHRSRSARRAAAPPARCTRQCHFRGSRSPPFCLRHAARRRGS